MNRILKNKEYWSEEELKELEDAWKSVDLYKDVEAKHIGDCGRAKSECPEGCDLTIHKPNGHNEGWDIASYDYSGHKKTVYCRKHGYARIYVISERDYNRTKNLCSNDL